MSAAPVEFWVAIPYWERSTALRAGLRALAAVPWGRLGLSPGVSIRDDGSTIEPPYAAVQDEWEPRASIVSSAEPHGAPRNSANAISSAILQATSNPDAIVAVMNPETIVPAQVVARAALLLEANPRGYFVAECRTESGQWYEHRTFRPVLFHWFAVARLAQWRQALPLPSWLMDGHCYEDNILRNRMLRTCDPCGWIDAPPVVHRGDLQRKGKKKGCWSQQLVHRNRTEYELRLTDEDRAALVRNGVPPHA